jgi:hypothetical protein
LATSRQPYAVSTIQATNTTVKIETVGRSVKAPRKIDITTVPAASVIVSRSHIRSDEV